MVAVSSTTLKSLAVRVVVYISSSAPILTRLQGHPHPGFSLHLQVLASRVKGFLYKSLLQIHSGELVCVQSSRATNIDQVIGHTRVRIIGTLSSHINSSSSSQGYTKNHFKFSDEMDQFQRKASCSVSSGIVTVKVILTRPDAWGSNIIYLAIDAVCSHLMEGHCQGSYLPLTISDVGR